jgi:26S proteasome regulatory subunit N8
LHTTVPFEEDPASPDVYFLDHDYLEAMFGMFRKVNAKEQIVGWYHTGEYSLHSPSMSALRGTLLFPHLPRPPLSFVQHSSSYHHTLRCQHRTNNRAGPKLRPGDVNINEVLRKFVADPVLVIVDVKPKALGLPVAAYVCVEEVHDDGTPTTKTFEHLTSEMGAEEAEEVGVEHLLRDIKDNGAIGSLTDRIQGVQSSVEGLHSHLSDIHEYLGLVVEGKLKPNHQISYLLQNVFNLIPNMDTTAFQSAVTVKTSDQLLVMYLGSLVRATIALHNVIDNQLANQKAEKEADDKDKAAATKAGEKAAITAAKAEGGGAADAAASKEEKK